MLNFYGSRADVVAYVAERLLCSEYGWPSIMITNHPKFADCYVLTVIATSSEDTVRALAFAYSLKPLNTSTENTQAG